MGSSVYYGHYRSTTTSQTGCVKEFLTTSQLTMLFPPQVQYLCDLCKVEHGFRFMTGHIVATPSQKKSLVKYCTDRGIEQDVTFD